MKKHYFFPLLLIGLLIISCKKDDAHNTQESTIETFGIFSVKPDKKTVLMSGEISSETLKKFNAMLIKYPDINLINMGQVPGSNDDEVNFQVGIKLRKKGINTHILDNSEIASGGVDFFLAGAKRTHGSNVKLGVHSWSDDSGRQATDFPKDSEEHLPNIQYFEGLGYSPAWARSFYFFTINAAPANDIHLMTEQEIKKYGIFN